MHCCLRRVSLQPAPLVPLHLSHLLDLLGPLAPLALPDR